MCKISLEKKKSYPISEKLHAAVLSGQQRAEEDKCPGLMLATQGCMHSYLYDVEEDTCYIQ